MALLHASRLGLTLADADGKTWPLWDFDLHLVSGATLAIVASRPGLASAMLKVLSSQTAPGFGGVLLDGREFDADDARIAIVRRDWPGLGIQRAETLVRSAVRAGADRRLSREQTQRWVRHHLSLVNATDLAGSRLRWLSPGALARVQLARAFAGGPSVLFLDHLLDGIGGASGHRCLDCLLELQESLTPTLVMATGDIDQAVLFADQVLCLDTVDGRIVARHFDVHLPRPRARQDLQRDQQAQLLVQSLWRREPSDVSAHVAPAPSATVVELSHYAQPRQGLAGKMLEKRELTLGFLPLTDCAPLAIALEEGFFAGEGLSVTLSRESSWSNILDKVSLGLLDGAQMLAPMPLAARLGHGAVPMVTAVGLGCNGNGITLSHALFETLGLKGEGPFDPMQTALALRVEVDRRKRAGLRRLALAVVGYYSTHNYLLRYWLASAGIDPDGDVVLSVVPPSQMVAYLSAGMIDGCCVGEPWNTVALDAGAGRPVHSSWQIWNNHPEKVLGVTRAWAEAHPNTHQALIRALLDACWWLDKPGNRPLACEWLSHGRYVNQSPDVLMRSLSGTAGFDAHLVFSAGAANFPWHSHAAWFVSQMVRWGQFGLPDDVAGLCAATYRTDLYRQASAFGDALPDADSKCEGTHETAWRWHGRADGLELGGDHFMDGRLFDSEQMASYLRGFEVSAASRRGRAYAA